MFNFKKLDIRTWILSSFILMSCLMVVQAYINDGFEKKNQLSIEKTYKKGTELQLEIKDLRVAFSQQITFMKDLLLRGKDGELYHLQLSQYYASERDTFELMEQTFFLLQNSERGKLLSIKINNEYRNLVKHYRKGIRVFNASDEQAHIFADRILKDSEKPFVALLAVLNKLAVKLQHEKIRQLKVEAEKRNFYSWVLIIFLSIPFVLFLYIVLDRKVKELRDSEIRYQRAEQGTNDGLWDWNILTNENYFSPRYIELLGYSPEDEFPQTMENFSTKLYPNDIERVMEAVREHLEEHKPYDIEYQLQMKDGAYKWFLARGQAIWDDEGKPIRMTGLISDISSRKQAEEQLRRINDQLQTSIENMPNAYILWDQDLHVIEWNKAAEEIFGYSKQEMLGKNPVDYIVPKPVRHLAGDALRKLEIGEVADYSEKDNNIRKDGELITCQWFNTPLTDKNGDVSCILTLGQDITERVKTEESLREISEINETIIAESPIGLAIYDHTGQCIAANQSIAEMVGATREQMLMQNYNEIESWEKSGLLAAVRKAASNDTKERLEISVRTTFDKDVYFDFRIVPFQNEGKTHLLLMADDISERKATDNALKASELMLEKAQELTHIGHFIMDPAKNTVAGSEELFRIFDFAKEGATFDNFVEVVHPDDREMDVVAIQRGIEHGESWDIEHRLIRRDGTEKWVHAIGEATTDETGKVVELLGTVQDISELKYAEVALRESEKKLKEAQRIAKVGSWELNIIENRLEWSDETYYIFEVDKNEFDDTYDAFLSTVHPDDVDMVNKIFTDSLMTKEPYEVDHRIKMSDGRIKFVRETCETQFNKEGKALFSTGIVQDLTERVEHENAIKESERLLKDAQHIAHMGYLDWDPLTNDITWSDETYRIYGFPLDFKPTLESTTALIHKDDAERVTEALNAAIQNKEDYDIKHRMVRPDGKVIYVHAKGDLTRNKQGVVTRMLGTIIDITKSKKIEFELEKYRENLEELVEERTKELKDAQNELVRKERLATLGQLTATVSHELRNPLGAMRPSLYVIEKKSDKTDERIQSAIERIDRNIDRCDHIIDELLSFTRITDLDLEPIQIDTWLETVIEEQVIPEGINIEKEFGLKNIEILIDTARLRRAMINVMENACHSMMDDNQNLVKTNNSYLKIKTMVNNERVEITITDAGSGIKKDNLDKIFEPLFSTKSFGVGLGMPAIKQIMQQHGGEVEIESEEGKGTVVTLWLPLNESE